ncbi:hypothetical protein M422DRAFT_185462, partial [Sphaerobolus stellatus SS14]
LQNHSVQTLKQKGIIKDDVRDAVRDLITIGVSRNKIFAVLQRVFRLAGINLEGKLSPRSVSRMVLEGGVASDIQLVETVTTASGAFI